jgi:hypothetical protein
MAVLYAESVDKELFLERWDEKVSIPDIGQIFMHERYSLYMLLNDQDRSDKDNPLFRDVVFDDHVYARTPVLLRDKRVFANDEGLKTAGFVVVSFLGKLGTNIAFDSTDMVASATPTPEFTIEIEGEIFRAPFSMAFLHSNPHIN